MKKDIPTPKQALHEQLHGSNTSLLQRYCLKTLGSRSFFTLLYYEIALLLCGNVAGGLGYLLRKLVFPRLFKQSGHGLILGKGLILRHPGKMSFGKRVAIDDYAMLDASGSGEGGITFGDDVIISRNCIIQGKTGPVHIGNRADIGCNVVLSSVAGITIGKAVLIAGNCYLGGGRYYLNRLDQAIMDQGGFSRGPLSIGDGAWLGAGAVVLDGVQIGKGCVVGAGSVVTRDLPDYSIALGVPAQVVRMRAGVSPEQHDKREDGNG
ncbi:MAG: acyltransferase [Desulfobulbaceae bacterium]|nr:acyltransferase [Desulfobulbaceae bacterium]